MKLCTYMLLRFHYLHIYKESTSIKIAFLVNSGPIDCINQVCRALLRITKKFFHFLNTHILEPNTGKFGDIISFAAK